MFILYNGKYASDEVAVLPAADRSYRYGDGLFETMRYSNGRVGLWEWHMERLFKGIARMDFPVPALFTPELLEKAVTGLLRKNKIQGDARIRLSLSRGSGGLYDPAPGLSWLLESWPLPARTGLNENGLVTAVYHQARIAIDDFSGLKKAGCLHYATAAVYARKMQLNDCILLNTNDTIADSTMANIFIRKADQYFSPGPAQGAVDGVMRRYLISRMREAGIDVQEEPVTPRQLLAADEVFFTNAIHGIRRVRQVDDTIYTSARTEEIYRQFLQTIP